LYQSEFFQRLLLVLHYFSKEPFAVVDFRHTKLVYNCDEHQSSQLFTLPMQAAVYSVS